MGLDFHKNAALREQQSTNGEEAQAHQIRKTETIPSNSAGRCA